MKKHIIKIYCKQEIPCNPCVGACSKNAITIERLTEIPKFNQERCVGCLICVASCPGQALYYLNEETSQLIFPYEFVDRPATGETVVLVDEYANRLGTGKVIEYKEPKIFNKTTLIVVEGDLAILNKTRGIIRE